MPEGPHHFSLSDKTFLLDGKPFQIIAGEMHYQRIPAQYWRHRLRMARSMGFNSVCTYMFWNLHEPRQGQFDFAGNNDVAAFVRAADSEDLHVLLRPGPYVCSEWEFGGLPWWLLAIPDIRLRCMDERYVAAVRRYLSRVGEELANLQITRNGPILMAQVENEYGSYGNDHDYMRFVRETLRAHFDIPLYTADGATQPYLHAGAIDGTLPTINFGNNPAGSFAQLDRFHPDGPRMSGEYWCGRFSHWGEPWRGSNGLPQAAGLDWMLAHGCSVSVYLAHGGTNFGFMAGANFGANYQPTVSSYDFRAAIDEAGRPTPTYDKYREILSKYQGHALLPDPPAPTKIVEIPPFALDEIAPLVPFAASIPSPQLRPMETWGQPYGCVSYRTSIAGMPSGELQIYDLHDYAQVRLNGKLLATLDRRLGQNSVKIDNVPEHQADLEILVEAMGRINYGQHLLDRKGITERVVLNYLTLMNWEINPLPLDEAHLKTLQFSAIATDRPAFRRGTFDLSQIGDTFLDLRGWGKGYVWINGHNLGRFWHIGPQQTLYLPAPFLKQSANEVIVLDLEPGDHKTLAGLREPILDQVSA